MLVYNVMVLVGKRDKSLALKFDLMIFYRLKHDEFLKNEKP